MFGIDDAVIGSLAGSVLEGGLGLFGSKDSNKAAREAAEAQMAFQKQTLQNRHQWETDDLRKSGLNPILSVNSGAPGAAGASYAPTNTLASASSAAGSAAARAASLANLKADTVQKLAGAKLANTNSAKVAQDVAVQSPVEWAMNKITKNLGDAQSLFQTALPPTNAKSSSEFDKTWERFKPTTERLKSFFHVK